MMQTKKLLTAQDVANLLNIHVRTFYHWLKKHKNMPKPKKIGAGKFMRFDPDEIDKFIRNL